MENQEWYPFYFNGKETDIEVTKDGRARRVYKDWKIYPNDKIRNLVGEIDFNKRTLARGYVYVSFSVKDEQSKSRGLHQILASVFLGHTINKFDKIIDHIDNNPLNNNINNLQIVTPRFNSIKDKKNRFIIKKNANVYRLKFKIRNNEYTINFGSIEESENFKNKILDLENKNINGEFEAEINDFIKNLKNKQKLEKQSEIYITQLEKYKNKSKTFIAEFLLQFIKENNLKDNLNDFFNNYKFKNKHYKHKVKQTMLIFNSRFENN